MNNRIGFIHQNNPPEYVVEMNENQAQSIREVLYEAQDSDEIELDRNALFLLSMLNSSLPPEFDGFTGGENSR